MVASSLGGRPALRAGRVRALVRVAALLMAVGSARATDYYVDPDAADAYPSVQSAVNAITGQTEFNRANVFIAPGIYREIVTVNKPYVSFIGEGNSPEETTITFATTVSPGAFFNWGQVVEIQSGATAFMARNVTFENSTVDRNFSAAVALRSAADQTIFDNVRVLGYQDTLLVDESSRQYWRDSFITGDVDFIVGDATAVFDHCTIESTDYGWITAANTKRTTANGLVFLDCTLVPGTDRNPILDDRTSAQPRTVFLGRPWQWWDPMTMPSVVFIRAKMGHHIIAAGWDPWDDPGIAGANNNTNRDLVTRLSEFGSMDLNGASLLDTNGDGTPTGRVFWTDPMTEEQAANYTLERIFGPVTFWNSETQPETSGIPYESQGEDWHPIAQLAMLPTESGIPSQPVNISTRVGVQTGDNVLIAGFILTGVAPKQIMLRAIGPSLENAGISDALADPIMELRSADGTRIAFNNNWQYANEEEIIGTGIPPSDAHESAIHVTLSPGAYTAIVKGRHMTTGVALVEVYDLEPESDTQLANISTRGFVGGGDHVMIAGFILAGGSGGSKVIVRGTGPSLTAAGIELALADPTLKLHDSNGVAIAFNDNWKTTQRTEIEETGLAPSDEAESSIVASLPAGPYTAVLASRDGCGGVGIIEVYNLK
jgi:pectin methylesterase-like acyl-CoA thioesterase